MHYDETPITSPLPGLPDVLPVPGSNGAGDSFDALCLADRLLRRGFPVKLNEPGLVLCQGNTKGDQASLLRHLSALNSKNPIDPLPVWNKGKAITTLDISQFSQNVETQLSLLTPHPRRFETSLAPLTSNHEDPWAKFLENKFGARVDVEELELGVALLAKVLPWVGVRTAMSCHGHTAKTPLRIWFSNDCHSQWCRMIFDRLCPDLPVHQQWQFGTPSSPEDPSGPVMWRLGQGAPPTSLESQLLFDQLQLIARRLFNPQLCQRIRDCRGQANSMEELPALLDTVFEEQAR